eukprot:gene16738-8195_t
MFQRGLRSESNASTITAKLKRFDRKSKQLQVKSEQLQKENDEMEQRIVALRQMMQKEREDRERQGGNRWKSSRIGQDTNSPNAKTERKPTKPKGQPKFKVLSDKPIEKYKSKDSMNINAETLQSSLCGQCERVKAKLECVECGELYCPPCFKQFHSKGAMRKHAWQPVDQERPYSSKNKTENTKQTRVAVSTSRDSSIGQAAPKEAQMEDEDSLQNSGGMLLGGTYNEEESAASFQEALKEWRNSSSNLPSQKNGMWMNPVDEEAKPAVLHAASLLYANKLGQDKSNHTRPDRLLDKGCQFFNQVQMNQIIWDFTMVIRDIESSISSIEEKELRTFSMLTGTQMKCINTI